MPLGQTDVELVRYADAVISNYLGFVENPWGTRGSQCTRKLHWKGIE